MAQPLPERPRAFDSTALPWHLGRLAPGAPTPATTTAVFVVHGMGAQDWTATGVTLRAGFEAALESIRAWQECNPVPAGESVDPPGPLPPPFIHEGYWANYDELAATFPEDWAAFSPEERATFAGLWATRTSSPLRTYGWYLKTLIRLLSWRTVREVRPAIYLLYIPLLVVALAAFTWMLVRQRRLLTVVLNDVRLYAEPKGIVERAIIQRIDLRVGTEFLRLIGLGWDFRPLASTDQMTVAGHPWTFERVVWVAHSLGTVVSYNVLSDLFSRAAELETSSDPAQREGVATFRAALRRFYTMGSPLDKFAFLFPAALRPWPKGVVALMQGTGDNAPRWWVNLYNAMDPVSGALSSPLLCEGGAPHNRYAFGGPSAWVPGLAHVSYWSSTPVLRHILGRVFGRRWLRDRPVTAQTTKLQLHLAQVGFLTQAALLVALCFGLLWGTAWTWTHRRQVVHATLTKVLGTPSGVPSDPKP